MSLHAGQGFRRLRLLRRPIAVWRSCSEGRSKRRHSTASHLRCLQSHFERNAQTHGRANLHSHQPCYGRRAGAAGVYPDSSGRAGKVSTSHVVVQLEEIHHEGTETRRKSKEPEIHPENADHAGTVVLLFAWRVVKRPGTLCAVFWAQLRPPWPSVFFPPIPP